MTERPATRFRRTDHDFSGEVVAAGPPWRLHAGASDAMASLPVVGRHLEPLGGVTAMGVWGYRHGAGFVSASAKSWLTPGIGEIRKAERDQTQAVSDAALRGVVSGKDLDIEWPAPGRGPHRSGVRCTTVATCTAPRCATASTRATAGRMASQGSAGAAGARVDLRARRRLGARRPRSCRAMR